MFDYYYYFDLKQVNLFCSRNFCHLSLKIFCFRFKEAPTENTVWWAIFELFSQLFSLSLTTKKHVAHVHNWEHYHSWLNHNNKMNGHFHGIQIIWLIWGCWSLCNFSTENLSIGFFCVVIQSILPGVKYHHDFVQQQNKKKK